eukprot:s5769_g1.t3
MLHVLTFTVAGIEIGWGVCHRSWGTAAPSCGQALHDRRLGACRYVPDSSTSGQSTSVAVDCGCMGAYVMDATSSMGRSPLLGVLGFVLMPAVWSVPEALVAAELATAFPSNAGYVTWVTAAFGPFWGFLEGFLSWVAGVSDNSIYPVLFCDYLKHILPATADGTPRILCALAFALALSWLNYAGLNIMGWSAVGLAIFTILPFLYIVPAGLPEVQLANFLVVPRLQEMDWQKYLNVLFWNLNYWDSASTLAGEVRDPRRVFPQALCLAMMFVIASYVFPLFVGVGIQTDTAKLRWRNWRSGTLTLVGEATGGGVVKSWVVLSAAVSNIGQFTCEQAANAYQLEGMAELGWLPKCFTHRSRLTSEEIRTGYVFDPAALRMQQLPQQHLNPAIGASYGSAAGSDGCISSGSTNLPEERGRSFFFPLEPFWFLGLVSPSLYEFVPRHLRIVQSLPHLVLLVGTTTNAVLIGRVLEDCRHWSHRNTAYLAVLVTSGVFSLHSLWRLVCQMAQYRYDLQQRSAQIQLFKENLARQFQLLANELEDLLARSAETEVGLAERSLDAERRDLSRFLKNIGPKLADEPPPPFLEHFRQFLSLWLQMLAECAADPVAQPYSVIGEVEFNSFDRSCELAVHLSEQLKAKEIRFIRDHTEEGKKGVLSMKKAWKKMRLLQQKALKWTGLKRFAKTQPDEEEGDLHKAEVICELPARRTPSSVELYWFKFQLGAGCGFDMNEDNYPLRIRCMLFVCIILSPEHLSFMLSFVLGLGLLLVNAFLISSPSQVVTMSIAVTNCCTAFVLYDFLDIDTLQRLEQQALEMKAAAQQADERRKILQAFFARMQLLVSLWQMRTLPRLALMKRLSVALEDAAQEGGILPLLVDAVPHLDALENALLSLHFWQEEGKLSIEDKEEVQHLIQSAAAEGSIKDMLEKLPDVVTGHNTPYVGLATGLIIILALSTSDFISIVDLLNGIYCQAQLLEFFAFLHLRRVSPNLRRPFRVPLESMLGCIALLFLPIVFCLLLLVLPLIKGNWKQVVCLVAVPVAGLILHALLSLSRRRGWLSFTREPPRTVDELLAMQTPMSTCARAHHEAGAASLTAREERRDEIMREWVRYSAAKSSEHVLTESMQAMFVLARRGERYALLT